MSYHSSPKFTDVLNCDSFWLPCNSRSWTPCPRLWVNLDLDSRIMCLGCVTFVPDLLGFVCSLVSSWSPRKSRCRTTPSPHNICFRFHNIAEFWPLASQILLRLFCQISEHAERLQNLLEHMLYATEAHGNSQALASGIVLCPSENSSISTLRALQTAFSSYGTSRAPLMMVWVTDQYLVWRDACLDSGIERMR